MDAKQFTGRWQGRAVYIFFVLMCLYMTKNLVWPAHSDKMPVSIDYVGRFIGLCFFAGIGLGAFLFVKTFTVYTLDAEGILSRWFSRQKTMRWRDVADFRVTGGLDSDIILTDYSGRKMRVERNVVYDPKREITATLNERLAILREKKVGAIGEIEVEQKPPIWLSLFLLAFVGFLFWLIYFMLSDASFHKEALLTQAFLLLSVGVAGVFMGGMSLLLMTKRFYFRRGELYSGSIFGATTLSVNEIESVMSQTRTGNNTTIRTTTVQGTNGKKIVFGSSLPDYDFLREYIEQKANSGAVERGAEELEKTRTKELKQAWIILPLGFLVLYGMFGFFGYRGAAVFLSYRQLDQRGIVAEGRVSEKHIASDKKSTPHILYTFERGEVIYRGNCSVSSGDYERFAAGQGITVTFLPDNPNVSRIAASRERERARSLLSMTAFNLVLITLLFSFHLWSLLRASRRRKNAAAASISADGGATP